MTRAFFGPSVALVILTLFGGMQSQVFARTWTDATGKFSFEGELLAYDEETVILKRDKKNLTAVDVDKLSEKDQEYLKSAEAERAIKEAAGDKHAWKLRNGRTVVGRVVDYVRKDVVVQRRRGKIYVNDRLYDNLPAIYQIAVPRIVGHFENLDIDDKKGLEEWLLKQRGEPVKFTCEGVKLEIEDGDEYGVPFFFFGPEDLKVLEPGWKAWLAHEEDQENRKEHAREQARQRMMLQSQAEAYQRDKENQQRISVMQLGLLAVAAGATDLWEVHLLPGVDVNGPPVSVVVPARDSRAAAQQALSHYPGYTVGPSRRVNR